MYAKLPKPIFYVLTFTWGLPFTLLGLMAALALRIRGYKPKKHGYCFFFEVGEHWGGVNLGLFFIVDKHSTAAIRDHEHGHAVQNCYLGPLMLPLVALPSLIRSRYRAYLTDKKGVDARSLPPYDSAWFEGQATRLGREIVAFSESNGK
ncbi:MAG: hypothetical protein IJW21_08185 [Clostridia bacterium]|nr:hypothetical protein [Clostridia bacterium]